MHRTTPQWEVNDAQDQLWLNAIYNTTVTGIRTVTDIRTVTEIWTQNFLHSRLNANHHIMRKYMYVHYKGI